MSLRVTIAEAVKAELNSAPDGTFAQAFTAIRTWLPVKDVQELDGLTVQVVPTGYADELATRSKADKDIDVSIGIQKRINTTTPADADAMADLVEQIIDYLRARGLAAAPAARWRSTANEPAYSPEHMEQKSVFTSVVRVSYRVTE